MLRRLLILMALLAVGGRLRVGLRPCLPLLHLFSCSMRNRTVGNLRFKIFAVKSVICFDLSLAGYVFRISTIFSAQKLAFDDLSLNHSSLTSSSLHQCINSLAHQNLCQRSLFIGLRGSLRRRRCKCLQREQAQ